MYRLATGELERGKATGRKKRLFSGFTSDYVVLNECTHSSDFEMSLTKRQFGDLNCLTYHIWGSFEVNSYEPDAPEKHQEPQGVWKAVHD